MGLLLYSFGFLPCVRDRCGLYPHAWAYCFALFVFSLVLESVADCIHMGLLLYDFGFLPCVRIRCGLYPHGLTVVLFQFSPLCESPLRTVSTWAYCCTLLVFSLV